MIYFLLCCFWAQLLFYTIFCHNLGQGELDGSGKKIKLQKTSKKPEELIVKVTKTHCVKANYKEIRGCSVSEDEEGYGFCREEVIRRTQTS